MKKVAGKRIIQIAACCLAGGVVLSVLYRVLQNTEIVTICSGSTAGDTPQVLGNHVAWYDNYNRSLCLYDLHSRKTEILSHFYFGRNFQVHVDPMVSFSKEWLMWIDPSSTIAGYKLDSIRIDPEIIPINHLVDLQFPLVDSFSLSAGGDFVVWEDSRNQDKDIFGFNLKTREEFPICTDPGDQVDPDTDGNHVVWAQKTADRGTGLYGYDLKAHNKFCICDEAADRFKPKVSEWYVVWCQDVPSEILPETIITGKDLQNGVEFNIGQATFRRYNLDISGPLVVWTDDHNESEGEDIYGYDIETGGVFPICTNRGDQYEPAIDGRMVVWFDRGPQTLWTKLIGADTSSIRGRILTDELIYGKGGKPSATKPPQSGD